MGEEAGVVREFLAEYLASARGAATDLSAASATGDASRVGAIAHKLKSASRSVGALALGDLCAELENAARAGDKTVIGQRIPHVAAALAAVEACIGKILAAKA